MLYEHVIKRRTEIPFDIDISIGDHLYEKGDVLTLDDALRQADERLYLEKDMRKRKSILK